MAPGRQGWPTIWPRRQLTHLLHEHARDNADQPPRNEEPCTPQPSLSHIEPGLQYLLALSVASARSGPPGRMEGRTCACMPCHRYLYLLTAASAAARPCNARLGPPGQHLRMYCVLVGLPNHAAGPAPSLNAVDTPRPTAASGTTEGSLRLSGGAPSNQVLKADS